MGLYAGSNPYLQGVAVERSVFSFTGVVDLFDVFGPDGAVIAADLTAKQVEQVLERLARGEDATGADALGREGR